MAGQRVYWRDIDAKFRALGTRFGIPSLKGICEKIAPNITEQQVNGIRGVRNDPTDRILPSIHLEALFKGIEGVKFDGNFADFSGLVVDAWKVCWKDPNGDALFPITESVRAPSIIFDPHLKNHEEKTWNQFGVVDQRVIYTDSRAVASWASTRQDKDYKLYKTCLELVTHTSLMLPADIINVVVLGAGSPEKDETLISELWSEQTGSRNIFVCDSSLYMLVETHQKLMGHLAKHPNVHANYHCFDITDHDAWEQYGPRPKGKTIFVMFGGTVGNVNESLLMTSLEGVMKLGDVLLVGGSFYSSAEDLQQDVGTHITKQYGTEAKRLALNSIANHLPPKVTMESLVEQVRVNSEPANSLPELVKSAVPHTMAAVCRLARSSIGSTHKGDLILFVSRRYVLAEFINHLESLKFLERLPFPDPVLAGTYPYAHLLFERNAYVPPEPNSSAEPQQSQQPSR